MHVATSSGLLFQLGSVCCVFMRLESTVQTRWSRKLKDSLADKDFRRAGDCSLWPTFSRASFMLQEGADGRHLLSFQLLNFLPMFVNSRNAFEGLSVTAYR